MEVTKTSEAVQVTANLVNSVNLPVAVLRDGEGDKLIVVSKNLDLIYKAAVGMEAKMEVLEKELEALKAPPAEMEEIAEPDPVA